MKVQELLSDKSKWTKYAYARDKEGEPTVYTNPNTVSWCLAGAILLCYEHAFDVCDKVMREVKLDISTWNDLDTTTFTEVNELITKLDI